MVSIVLFKIRADCLHGDSSDPGSHSTLQHVLCSNMVTPQILVAMRLTFMRLQHGDSSDPGSHAAQQRHLFFAPTFGLVSSGTSGFRTFSYRIRSLRYFCFLVRAFGGRESGRPSLQETPPSEAACKGRLCQMFFVLVYMEQMFQMYGAYDKISV